jgi:hypothetical protein
MKIKKLSTVNPTGNVLTELTAWLDQVYAQDLAKLGFEIKRYSHVWDKEDEEGCHIVKFIEITQGGPSIMDESREADYKKLQEICTQDDDGQPHATYRLHNGTLWLFIPYVS